jgi:hypothetical protein
MKSLQIKSKLALQLGNWNSRGKLVYSNNVLAVDDFEDASHKWEAIRDAEGYGSSDCPIVVVVDTTTGNQVAKISYNGRVWDEAGIEIPIDGEKTAAQHEAEGWADYKRA